MTKKVTIGKGMKVRQQHVNAVERTSFDIK